MMCEAGMGFGLHLHHGDVEAFGGETGDDVLCRRQILLVVKRLLEPAAVQLYDMRRNLEDALDAEGVGVEHGQCDPHAKVFQIPDDPVLIVRVEMVAGGKFDGEIARIQSRPQRFGREFSQLLVVLAIDFEIGHVDLDDKLLVELMLPEAQERSTCAVMISSCEMPHSMVRESALPWPWSLKGWNVSAPVSLRSCETTLSPMARSRFPCAGRLVRTGI